MTQGNGNSKSQTGFLIQLGEILQTAIVGILDGSSTIFRAIVGTVKDSTVFAIRSVKEVTDEAGSAVTGSIKKSVDETRNVSIDGTRVAFGFVNELGKNLKTSTLNTIESSHEVTTKAANTFGKTLVDLSECAYSTGAKIGNITKTAALNTIRGTAEIGQELFGKIKSGVGGVINIEGFHTKKKVAGGPSEPLENN